MPWKPIVVGVDGSPESVRAAVLGALLAQRAGAGCHLVHAAPDYWTAVSAPELGLDVTELDRGTMAHARTLIACSLQGHVPARLVDDLEVRIGRGPVVLADAATRHGAELLVLGGKHHRGLDRVGGSTIVHMVRAHDLPVLATDGSEPTITRVLAAVDLSPAAGPVIAAAERWAGLFAAQLRVLHVVEPMPVVPGVTIRVGDEECYRATERLLQMQVWPLIRRPGTETVMRRGRSAAAIVDEVTKWHADLLIVGSHGKGWVDRLLLGSTSERLLHVLPATTLVVPVPSSSHAASFALSTAKLEPHAVAGAPREE